MGRVGITRSLPLLEARIGAFYLIRILGSGVEKGKRWRINPVRVLDGAGSAVKESVLGTALESAGPLGFFFLIAQVGQHEGDGVL